MDFNAIWEKVKALAAAAIGEAYDHLPNTDGKSREDFAVQFVLDRVEAVDQYLPVIGQFMDLPIVDWVEKMAVDAAVRAAFRLVVRQQFAVREIETAQ